MKSLIVNESKCTKCGLCAEVCPSKILCFGESGFPEMAKGCSESCIECGQCVVFCPASANSLSFMDADKLIRAADLSMPEPEAALNLLKTRRSIRKFQNKTAASRLALPNAFFLIARASFQTRSTGDGFFMITIEFTIFIPGV